MQPYGQHYYWKHDSKECLEKSVILDLSPFVSLQTVRTCSYSAILSLNRPFNRPFNMVKRLSAHAICAHIEDHPMPLTAKWE